MEWEGEKGTEGGWERKGRSCFSRIQLALASIKDVRAAFSPGEELDDGIAQELQSLVVIDPGQDEGGGDSRGGGGEETEGEVEMWGQLGERCTSGKQQLTFNNK